MCILGFWPSAQATSSYTSSAFPHRRAIGLVGKHPVNKPPRIIHLLNKSAWRTSSPSRKDAQSTMSPNYTSRTPPNKATSPPIDNPTSPTTPSLTETLPESGWRSSAGSSRSRPSSTNAMHWSPLSLWAWQPQEREKKEFKSYASRNPGRILLSRSLRASAK